MASIGVVIPVYIETQNHLDYTVKCLKSIKSIKNKIKLYVVPTKCEWKTLQTLQKRFKFDIVDIDINCVARAWNLGILRALSDMNEYVVVINSDVECFSGGKYGCTIDKLVDFAGNNKAIVWSANMRGGKNFIFNKNGVQLVNRVMVWNNYSFFMVDKRLFQVVGMFDENIAPAYGEDLDMQYRIELARAYLGNNNNIVHLCTKHAVYKHLGNGVINGCDNMDDGMKRFSQFSEVNGESPYKYICRKWGGERENMKFTHPFNDKNNDFRFTGYELY